VPAGWFLDKVAGQSIGLSVIPLMLYQLAPPSQNMDKPFAHGKRLLTIWKQAACEDYFGPVGAYVGNDVPHFSCYDKHQKQRQWIHVEEYDSEMYKSHTFTIFTSDMTNNLTKCPTG
jgi:hypothetical protein